MRGLPIAIAKNDGESSAIRAYLDIETTGLSPVYSEIAVIGIYLANGSDCSLVQLVGGQVTAESLVESLNGVHTIYTYNGRRFDLPLIQARLSVETEEIQECVHSATVKYPLTRLALSPTSCSTLTV